MVYFYPANPRVALETVQGWEAQRRSHQPKWPVKASSLLQVQPFTRQFLFAVLLHDIQSMKRRSRGELRVGRFYEGSQKWWRVCSPLSWWDSCNRSHYHVIHSNCPWVKLLHGQQFNGILNSGCEGPFAGDAHKNGCHNHNCTGEMKFTQ